MNTKETKSVTPAATTRRRALQLAWLTVLSTSLVACGSGGSDEPPASEPAPPPSPLPPPSNSPAVGSKRGVAYDLQDERDFAALAGSVSWWVNWAFSPNPSVASRPSIAQGMTHVPMLWDGNFDTAQVIAALKARPSATHLLLLNEPNLLDQANLTPQQAADLWPRYEEVARETGVKLVGPAMTWGTMPGYADPVVWLDDFHAAYRAAHGGRDPQIDHLAFHWYDYGLAEQLDRLAKYGKTFWVTEFANWHSQNDGAQIDSAAKQKAQMTEMVGLCEGRADVERYAWFTGRWQPADPHFTSLLAAPGALTEVGSHYVGLAGS